MATKTLTFPNDHTPLDLLLWLEFKREVPGLVEATFAGNLGLAGLGIYPPAGTTVEVTIPEPAARTPRRLITLFPDGS